MDRRTFSLAFAGVAITPLTGCLFDGTDTPLVALPELATATTLPAATVFAQSVLRTGGEDAAGPGQANLWDLNEDFSLEDGNSDQFDGALVLNVDVGGSVSFPNDQTFAELTAFGPELGAADGVKLVSFTTEVPFVVTGTTSAVLHRGPDVRLQQNLNLAAAVAPITLTWAGNDEAGTNNFTDEPFFLQVVIRSAAGALLATLYRKDPLATTGTFGTADLSAFAGQSVVLSFEQRSTRRAFRPATRIDDVSVLDNLAVQFVTNGNFEAGSTGWTVPVTLVAQNVRSGVRTLNGLEVQRSFFTQPNQLWGRWSDEFFNPGASAITAAISYRTNLGSDGTGIIYDTPGAVGKAITSWDGDRSDRDIGMVFGSLTLVPFTSDDGLGNNNGNEDITFTMTLTVPAGGRATLVNFIVMTGDCTGTAAVDISARATAVDGAVPDIANNFRTNFLYQRGMTQQQLDTLKNF